MIQSDEPLNVDAIAWRERIGPLPKGRRPDPASYVEAVPGEGGVDWGYTGDANKARPLNTYWQRRFRADMERVNARARFIPARRAPAGVSETSHDKQDNSWGRGYYPLPARLAGLGRFMDSLAPTKLLDHKVWPDDPTEGGDIHMLTVKDRGVNIFVRDLESLIEIGLLRIMSNEPGQVSFYFVDKEERAPRGLRGPSIRRRR